MCVNVCLGVFIIVLETSRMCVDSCLEFVTTLVRLPSQLLSEVNGVQLWKLSMLDFSYTHQQVALLAVFIFLGSVCVFSVLCAILDWKLQLAELYVVLSSWYSSVEENGALPTTAWKKAQQENRGDRMEKIKEQPENNEHYALGEPEL